MEMQTLLLANGSSGLLVWQAWRALLCSQLISKVNASCCCVCVCVSSFVDLVHLQIFRMAVFSVSGSCIQIGSKAVFDHSRLDKKSGWFEFKEQQI